MERTETESRNGERADDGGGNVAHRGLGRANLVDFQQTVNDSRRRDGERGENSDEGRLRQAALGSWQHAIAESD